MVEGDGLENRSASKGRQGFESLLLLQSTWEPWEEFPNPPALWLRRAKPAYAYAIMGTPLPTRLVPGGALGPRSTFGLEIRADLK